MKLVTYMHHGRSAIGAVVHQQIVDLSAVAPDMLRLIELGEEGLAQATTAVSAATDVIDLDAVQLQAPIPTPRRNVMCLGLNYAAHAAESYTAQGKDVSLPDVPIVFTKATTAVSGPYDDIPFDAAVSELIDWEVELAVIIGKTGKDISAEEALSYAFGYMVLNDVSARDLQRRGKQYFKGKSLDGACPCGPWIVTADEIGDPQNLRITSRVNGVTKQDDTTAHMIFDVAHTIAYLSQGMTLLPGDIIATGTPEGVGFARKPPEYLQPGDVVACEVEKVGIIENRVTAVG